MEDSAYNSLMLGVYVFIFITAISLTIYLFSSTVSFSDKAYEYGKVTSADSIVETTSAPIYNTVTGSELLTYYYNYKSPDKYGTAAAVTYDFQNIDDIQINKTYTLIYESANTGAKPVIKVVEVASEQSSDLGAPIVVDKRPTDPVITTFPYVAFKALPNTRIELKAESIPTYSVLTNYIKSYYWKIDYSPEDGRADFTTTTYGAVSQLREADFPSQIEFKDGTNTIFVTSQDALGNYSNTISKVIEIGYNDPTINSIVENNNKVFEYGNVAMDSPTGVALQLVSDTMSNNPGGYIQKSDWYVNDVLVQSGGSQILSKNFVPGAYTVKLTVYDSIQGTATKTFAFTVLNIPAPVISCSNNAVIVDHTIAITTSTVNLTFDATLAAKYGIVKYLWSIDGAPYETIVPTGLPLNYSIGTHTISVHGLNSEGIISDTRSLTFVVKEDYVPFEKVYTPNGSYYTETLPAGKYLFETLGAQGGNSAGGYGGYSSGILNLTATTTFYIYVGSSAGYNGGGTSRLAYSYGGGATDIRMTSGTWNNATSLISRIMVAGGGGGNGGNSTACAGGSAGGITGYTGGTLCGAPGTGGTQTTGGLAPRVATYGATNGSFGTGGNGEQIAPGSSGTSGGSTGSTSGAGGGGYYGGGGAMCDYPRWNDLDDSGGGGGSSFISGYSGCNSVNISGVHTGQANHYSGLVFINSTMTPAMNTGDGKAKITRLISSYNFSYTGTLQNWVVPQSGRYKLENWGAQGGNALINSYGGLGGYSSAEYVFTAGTSLNINVGGQGLTTNGSVGGRGGEASDVRLSGTALTNRIIVAGGGGGASYTGTEPNQSETGGVGGGPNQNGGDSVKYGTYIAGIGATTTSGYSLGLGQIQANDGGSGGNGYYGGFAGAVMGGGGGSGYVNTSIGSNVIGQSGINSGNGKVVISYIGQ